MYKRNYKQIFIKRSEMIEYFQNNQINSYCSQKQVCYIKFVRVNQMSKKLNLIDQINQIHNLLAR